MARPLKEVDVETLKKLAQIHCTMEEIGNVLGVSVDTLERRFADIIKSERDGGKMSLRRAMFKKALVDGNPTMLIWLSKQHLGMSDKIEQKVDSKTTEEIISDTKRLLNEIGVK